MYTMSLEFAILCDLTTLPAFTLTRKHGTAGLSHFGLERWSICLAVLLQISPQLHQHLIV